MRGLYVKNVPSERWVTEIKRESGFLMKNRENIEIALEEEKQHRDGTKPMDEMQWANNQGWIEALEWVLGVNNESNK